MSVSDPGPDTGIVARRSPYLDRFVQVGLASGRVISVTFPEDEPPEATEEHPLLDRIFDYLDGLVVDFTDIKIALTVPTGHRDVLMVVRSIPYGTDRDVGTVARMTPGLTDDESGHSTVRTALASNPAPLLIPDHRVRDGPSGAPPAVEQKLRSLEGL